MGKKLEEKKLVELIPNGEWYQRRRLRDEKREARLQSFRPNPMIDVTAAS